MPPDDSMHDLDEIAAHPRPDIRLIVTDMDGTLLDDDRQTHDELWPLVHQLHEQGIAFGPASGRHVVSLRDHFASIAEEVTYIASNGAHVLAGSTELHSDCLPPELARDVLQRLRHVPDARAVLVGKSGAFVERGDERAFAWIRAFVPPMRFVPDITAAVDELVDRGDGVLSVGIFDNRSAETNSLPALAPVSDQLNIMATQPTWVDVVSPTADKGHAVAQLQRDLGIGPDQTVVFGDFLNDLGMMEQATYAFAMANAHPDVTARAWRTAPANTSNGVVRTIRALLDLDG